MSTIELIPIDPAAYGGRRGKIGVIEDRTSHQYPCEWWERNKNEKPSIDYEGYGPDHYWSQIKGLKDVGSWNDARISNYLISIIKVYPEPFTVKLDEDWTANPHGKVGEKGQEITPLSLLTVKGPEAPLANPSDTVEEHPQDFHISMFACLLGLYRVIHAKSTAESYGKTIVKKISTVMPSSSWQMSEENFLSLDAFITDNSLTPNYKKIVAAVDMLFYRHPTHQYASIRTCTINSRYRGCTAITSVNDVSKAMGMKPGALLSCILTPHVGREAIALTSSTDYHEQQESYFPYHLDLGLVDKSGYSASANPTLILWIHTIGCMLNMTRSANALKVNGAHDEVTTVETAICVAQCMGAAAPVAVQFGTTDDRVERKRKILRDIAARKKPAEVSDATVTESGLEDEGLDVVDFDDLQSGMPPRLGPDASFEDRLDHCETFYTLNGGLTPAQVKDAAHRFKSYLTNRTGTIGYFLALRYSARDA